MGPSTTTLVFVFSANRKGDPPRPWFYTAALVGDVSILQGESQDLGITKPST